jgi:ligand-binding sensor domain-containing protein
MTIQALFNKLQSGEHHMSKKFSLLIATCLVLVSASAQLIDLPNIEIISQKNGLPFNTMSSIVQDRQGFIWIGSADGLARYDGYTFVTVPRNVDARKLSFNAISTIGIDKTGKLWIGQLGGLVSRLNPSTEHFETFKIEGGEDKIITTIFCDSKGIIWCFMGHTGLYRFDGKTFNFVGALPDLPQNASGLPATYNNASSIHEDSDHTFWIASSNGLYHFSPATSTFQHLSSLSPDSNLPTPIHQIIPDGKKGFWCATYGYGLVYFDVATNQYQSFRYQKGHFGTNNIIYGAWRKDEDEMWISTSGNGLGVFNDRTKKFSFFHEGSLEGNGPVCTSMLVDQLGIIWVISDKGLMKWNTRENHFRFSKLKVTRTDNHDYYGVSDVFEDKATGRKIIATSYADGLHVFDSTGKETVLSFDIHPAAEPYLIVTDLMRTRDGRILMTSRDYLYELTRDNRLQKIPGPNSALDTSKPAYFLRMAQSANGDIWIASSRNGLIHFDAAKKIWDRLHTQNTPVFPDNRIVRIGFDKQQRLWVGHHRSGISRFDPGDNSWVHYKHEPKDSTSLVSNLLSDMIITLSGDVWIATLEGLSRFDNKTNSFINFTLRTGLPSQTIYEIASDDNNNIWAMANKGMMMMPSNGGAIQQYDHEQGIEGVYSAFIVRRGSEGKMYGCTYRGYFTFYPSLILNQKREHSSVIITDVKNGNTSLLNGQQKGVIPVNYTDNSLTIEFAALNFLDAQNIYQYKMLGLNSQWSESSNRSVTYSSLPSGNYIFEVSLVGDPSYAAALKIEVTTPFWRQWWFRSFLMALGLAGVYLVYRLRLNQIRHDAKLKTEFNQKLAEVEMKALKAQMSPHFIFNSLNSINRYIIKAEPEKASLYLTKFSKLIRLILDNSNLKIISLEQEINALKLYIELEALRFNEKFAYTLTVNPELNPMSIGVPPMIIQPFIENAIWHGLLHKESPGQLDISIERFGSGLKCIITDNGVGRKKAAELKSKSVNKEKSYGMKITKDRLAMLNGESKVSGVEIIDLEDEKGNSTGTQVIVKIMAAELEPEF